MGCLEDTGSPHPHGQLASRAPWQGADQASLAQTAASKQPRPAQEAEALETETKLFEDLEFQQLEKESRLEEEHEMLHSEAQGRHRLARRKVSPEPPLGLQSPSVAPFSIPPVSMLQERLAALEGQAEQLRLQAAQEADRLHQERRATLQRLQQVSDMARGSGHRGGLALTAMGKRTGTQLWGSRCAFPGNAKEVWGGSSDPPPPCSAFPNRRRKPSWHWSNGSVHSLGALPFPRARVASERFAGSRGGLGRMCPRSRGSACLILSRAWSSRGVLEV